tara:strand:+ start:21788 stop:22051 length:264 start_codon:yes stop_codon:yes gene_type:complete
MKDSWRTIAITSISCITLMMGFWLVESKNYISRAAASEMIRVESPYAADRQLVLKNLDSINQKLEENNKLINELNVEIARLRAELKE